MLDLLIVGGSPEPSTPSFVHDVAGKSRKVVACDAGGDACKEADVAIDAVVGDLDSCSDEAIAYAKRCGAEFLTYPEDKDATDLALALDLARRERADCIGDACAIETRQADPQRFQVGLTCVSGGRLDHMLAVLGTLCESTELAPVIYEDSYALLVLEAPTLIEFDDLRLTYPLVDELYGPYVGRTISLLSLDGRARVSENGMKWDLDHVVLEPLGDLGVSNVVASDHASVEVFGGTCALMLLKDYIHKVR
ncbi:MAG: thiamine diphosphokinase [Coriobacteriales bacterium]